MRLIAFGTYDNFNPVVAGVKGNLASGLQLVYENLTTAALDEISSEYGLLAEAVSYPPDRSSVSYRLRSQARWHDGKPVTPEDVIFSFDIFKKNSPQLAAYYRHVKKAEKTGEREVTFVFDAPGNRELPQIVGQLTVLPKHWWEGIDAKGKKRDVTQTTLEPPLGSGPYKMKDYSPGRNLAYEKVPDIGARISTSISASIISRKFATNITATPLSRSRPSRATGSTGAPRSAQRTGRPPILSGGQGKEGGAGGIPDPQFRHHAGLRLQHPGATSSRIRACAAPSISR